MSLGLVLTKAIVRRAALHGVSCSQRDDETILSLLSCSREDDRLASRRLVRVWITLEENVATFSSSFPLGESTSRGHPSQYAMPLPSAQRAATSPADLPAQRMRTQIPAAALEPALLPGPGMPAASPPLASGPPPDSTSPRCPLQSAARPGREESPSARQGDAQGP